MFLSNKVGVVLVSPYFATLRLFGFTMNLSRCKVFDTRCLFASHLRSCVLHYMSISTDSIIWLTFAFIVCQGNRDLGAVVALIVMEWVTSDPQSILFSFQKSINQSRQVRAWYLPSLAASVVSSILTQSLFYKFHLHDKQLP